MSGSRSVYLVRTTCLQGLQVDETAKWFKGVLFSEPMPVPDWIDLQSGSSSEFDIQVSAHHRIFSLKYEHVILRSQLVGRWRLIANEEGDVKVENIFDIRVSADAICYPGGDFVYRHNQSWEDPKSIQLTCVHKILAAIQANLAHIHDD